MRRFIFAGFIVVSFLIFMPARPPSEPSVIHPSQLRSALSAERPSDLNGIPTGEPLNVSPQVIREILRWPLMPDRCSIRIKDVKDDIMTLDISAPTLIGWRDGQNRYFLRHFEFPLVLSRAEVHNQENGWVQLDFRKKNDASLQLTVNPLSEKVGFFMLSLDKPSAHVIDTQGRKVAYAQNYDFVLCHIPGTIPQTK